MCCVLDQIFDFKVQTASVRSFILQLLRFQIFGSSFRLSGNPNNCPNYPDKFAHASHIPYQFHALVRKSDTVEDRTLRCQSENVGIAKRHLQHSSWPIPSRDDKKSVWSALSADDCLLPRVVFSFHGKPEESRTQDCHCCTTNSTCLSDTTRYIWDLKTNRNERFFPSAWNVCQYC